MLTPKREKFCQEYVRIGNASAAYRAAYDASKMAMTTIHKKASELLSKGEVRGRIEEIRKSVAKVSELDTARILNEISRLLSSDVRSLFHPDGRLKLPHELDDDTAAAVASVKIDADGKVEYKFWDKNSALEKASKIEGLFEKDNSQRHPGVLDGVPRETLKLIEEKLSGLIGSQLARSATARSPIRTSH